MSWDDSDDDWEANVPVFNAPAAAPAAAPTFSDDEEVVSDTEDFAAVPGSKPKVGNKGGIAKAKKKSKLQEKKERELQLQLEAERAKNAVAMTDEERAAERARLQRLAEDADGDLAADMLSANTKIDGTVDGDVISSMLAKLDLAGQSDYATFAKSVAKKLELENSALRTREFLKELLRSACTILTDLDVVELINLLGVIKNEKVKKVLNKKKKNKSKAVVKMDRGGFDDDLVDDYGGGATGGYYDDDDFM